MKFFATSKNRLLKAKKIDRILSDVFEANEIINYSILDLGSGSGHIANYFSQKNNVIACDVINQIEPKFRKLKFIFIKKNLPFYNSTFDIIILNHVLMYVKDQKFLLEEIHRVLKKDGICYIATPNKVFPIDPNLKVPLINYLPNRLYNKFISFFSTKRQHLSFLQYNEIISLFNNANFKFLDYTYNLITRHKFYGLILDFNFFPKFITKFSPAYIFILRKNES